MSKVVLITGGTGFLGGNLIPKFIERGYHVYVLTRPHHHKNKRPDVTYITTLDKAPDRLDVVINLAGEPLDSNRWSDTVKRELIASRVDLTHRLIDYLETLESQPEVLISGSAIGYYGSNATEVFTEHTVVPSNLFSAQLCCQWEDAALKAESLGVRVCRIRTGVVLGQGGGMLSKILTPFKLGLGARLGHGQQWLSWIHLEDWIQAVLWLIDHPVRGPVNLTAPNPVTNQEFTKKLAATLNCPQFLNMPECVVKVLFGQMADELLLVGQHVIPQVLQESGYKFKYPEIQQALDNLIAKK